MCPNRVKLAGVFAPVVTPFASDQPASDSLKDNLRKLRDTRLTGYLALGSNGEFKSLSESEQFKILSLFAQEKGDKVIMVGTACESTRQTIDKSKKVAELGFDYVSILTPHYFAKQMSGPTLQDYYQRIADALSIPVLLYNAPGFTGGVQIPVSTVQALARHQNIVGMKDSSPAGPAKYLSALDPSEDFVVLAGSANFFYPSLHMGAVGGIISLANALPEPCCRLHELFIQGNYKSARDLHFRLSRLNAAISGTTGVAGVKAAMDVTGFKGGAPRHPLKPVSGEDKARIRAAIQTEGFEVV
jgi:4-hydroxy-2-oxoglutarate aldolase